MKREFFTVILLIAILFSLLVAALWIIDPPPMVGYVSDKDRHPAYYPVDANTPEVFVLAITNGKRCYSWKVSEERYHLYEIGDPVEWVPRMSKEDF